MGSNALLRTFTSCPSRKNWLWVGSICDGGVNGMLNRSLLGSHTYIVRGLNRSLSHCPPKYENIGCCACRNTAQSLYITRDPALSWVMIPSWMIGAKKAM